MSSIQILQGDISTHGHLPAAIPVSQFAARGGKVLEPRAQPSQSDTVSISGAAKAAQARSPEPATHEAGESTAETSQEARGGDPQAIRLLSRRIAEMPPEPGPSLR